MLIFVPAFTSHSILDWQILAKSTIACLAFGLCASGLYVANDLLGLEEDRHHSSKRNRPFASGQASLLGGVVVAAACLIAGLNVAAIMGTGLLAMLLSYICVTTYYSLYLKRILLVDVITLALLYTLRIIAGHVVTGISFSPWLLSFAFFLFLSLAFSKRAAELVKLRESGENAIPGRGYESNDLQVITTIGICSGFLSSLVLALYINSEAVTLTSCSVFKTRRTSQRQEFKKLLGDLWPTVPLFHDGTPCRPRFFRCLGVGQEVFYRGCELLDIVRKTNPASANTDDLAYAGTDYRFSQSSILE